jgi:hypothetical protein
MKSFGDNFILIIPMEDTSLHTREHPVCTVDPLCPCHTDSDLIAAVTQEVTAGLLTSREAMRLVAGHMLWQPPLAVRSDRSTPCQERTA